MYKSLTQEDWKLIFCATRKAQKQDISDRKLYDKYSKILDEIFDYAYGSPELYSILTNNTHR